MVELEALAIYWAIRKFHTYLDGISFEVLTDHEPLKNIFKHQTLQEIENPTVQNYRSRSIGYNIVVCWIRGEDHAILDTLSRTPAHDPHEDYNEEEE